MRETAPWTIKGVPVKVRQLALKCANAQDQTMADWMADAVHKLAAEQSGMIMPPQVDLTFKMPRSETLNLDLVGLAAAVQAAVEAHKAAGIVPPAGLARDTTATVRKVMRQARGVGDKKKPSIKTIEHNGIAG